VKSRTQSLALNVTKTGRTKYTHTLFVSKLLPRRPLAGSKKRDDNIKMYLAASGCNYAKSIEMEHDHVQWQALVLG
jgi:hypothetical protein